MMRYRLMLISLLFTITSSFHVRSQTETMNEVAYKTIAQGTDSPIADLQIVCFNKFFNKDYLPTEFNKKYNLDDKTLFKKKMLIEIFHSDKEKQGLDKIELIGIKENDEKLIIEYNVVNSDTENDSERLSPFLIVQVPKSKKELRFIVDGIELEKATDLYVD